MFHQDKRAAITRVLHAAYLDLVDLDKADASPDLIVRHALRIAMADQERERDGSRSPKALRTNFVLLGRSGYPTGDGSSLAGSRQRIDDAGSLLDEARALVTSRPKGRRDWFLIELRSRPADRLTLVKAGERVGLRKSSVEKIEKACLSTLASALGEMMPARHGWKLAA